MDELFDDRPAPWRVEKHRMGSASVVDANNYTVLTCNGAALAAFIADAANAFASDEYVFIAANNNAEKIAVLTIQRDEAREQLTAAQARIAALEAFRDAAGAYAESIDGGVDRLAVNVNAMQLRIAELESWLHKIADRDDDEMRSAMTLHYDMRGWARAALAGGGNEAARSRIAELEAVIRKTGIAVRMMTQGWQHYADDLNVPTATEYEGGKADALTECARELSNTHDIVMQALAVNGNEATQSRIIELEARHAALHDALRTMAAQWVDLVFTHDANPRKQGEAEAFRQCAHDLAVTLRAALAGAETKENQS